MDAIYRVLSYYTIPYFIYTTHILHLYRRRARNPKRPQTDVPGYGRPDRRSQIQVRVCNDKHVCAHS